jgi:hypothetical protein
MNHAHNKGWLFSRTGIATLVAVSVLGFLIYTGHSAHLMGALPYLLILACPLMHIFMHGGHGGHHHQSDDEQQDSENTKKHKHSGGYH